MGRKCDNLMALIALPLLPNPNCGTVIQVSLKVYQFYMLLHVGSVIN